MHFITGKTKEQRKEELVQELDDLQNINVTSFEQDKVASDHNSSNSNN